MVIYIGTSDSKLLKSTATVASELVDVAPDSCFNFNSGTKTITDYYNNQNNNSANAPCPKVVEIPSKIGGVAVENIGNSAFSGRSLVSVIIPDSVTSIGDSAFESNQLTSVTIPDSVETIGNTTFYRNQLTSAAIPDSVTAIGYKAFYWNQLISVTIPDSVNTVGNDAFGFNKISSVIIEGDNIASAGTSIFGANPVDSFIYNGTFYTPSDAIINDCYIVNDNGDGTASVTGLLIADINTIQNHNNACLNKDLDIPSTIDSLTVASIGANAFQGSRLNSVIIPDSVTTIGNKAFADNKLTFVDLGDSVEIIGSQAFQGAQLTSVTLPDSVTTIDGWAFYSNQLTSVTIPGSVQTIGSYAFFGNQLTSVIILSDTIANVGGNVFKNNPIDFFTYSNTTYTMFDATIDDCYVFDPGTGTITEFNFADINTIQNHNNACLNKDLDIPSTIDSLTVASIGARAFQGSRLNSVIIPDSVTTIGSGAFKYNRLASITLPDSVTTIGDNIAGYQFISGGYYTPSVFAANGNIPEQGQAYVDSLVYAQVYYTDPVSVGLIDQAIDELHASWNSTGSDITYTGIDINGNGNTTDLISAQIINPAYISINYQDQDGNPVAIPDSVPTMITGNANGTDIVSYLVKDNPDPTNLDNLYRAGDTFNQTITPPSVLGYTTPDAQTVNMALVAGANTVNFVYTPTIISLPDPVTSEADKVTLSIPEDTVVTCSSTVSEDNLDKKDEDYSYPLGLVDFCLDTNSLDNQITLTFITDLTSDQVIPRKYNPDTKEYSFLPPEANANITETTVDGKHALVLTYNLKDNGPLDLDDAIGKLKDPVGLAIEGESVSTPGPLIDSIGNLMNTGQGVLGLMALGAIILLGGYYFSRGKKQALVITNKT